MKTLIIYSTKYGCVENIAKILQTKLDGEVALANVSKSKAINMDGYDRVILGGSIYVGRIQKEMTDFAAANMKQLLEKKLGLYICGAQPEESVKAQELKDAYPGELHNHASAAAVLGDAIYFDKLKFMDKMITKSIMKLNKSYENFPEEKIESFVKAMRA